MYTFIKLHDRRIPNVGVGVGVGPVEFQLMQRDMVNFASGSVARSIGVSRYICYCYAILADDKFGVES